MTERLKIALLNAAESLTIRLAYYTDRLDTYVQTRAGASRWAAGPGRRPTKAEARRLLELAQTRREER